MAFGGGSISLLALISIGPGAPSTPARPPAIPVDFDAPAGCSDVDAFRRGIAARLDRPAAVELGAGIIRLQVHLTRVGARVEGRLRLIREQGATDTRRVEGARCDEVVEVLALTAALALEPRAVAAGARAPDPAGAPAPATPPRGAGLASGAPRVDAAPGIKPPAASPAATSATPRAPPEVAAPRAPPAPVPRVATPRLASDPVPAARAADPPSVEAPAVTPAVAPRPGWWPEAGAGATLARVVSPGVNLGGALMLGLTRRSDGGVPPSLRLALLYLPNDVLVPAPDVVTTWGALSLGACPGWGLERGGFTAQVCARGVAGRLTATDRGVSNPRSATRTWWSAGAFLRGAAAVGAGFAVELEAGVDAVLVERRFITTTPLQDVAHTPSLAVLVGLGVSRRL